MYIIIIMDMQTGEFKALRTRKTWEGVEKLLSRVSINSDVNLTGVIYEAPVTPFPRPLEWRYVQTMAL